MLTLAPCPWCATRIPDDGAYCDTCSRRLAACPTCNALAKPGEKCLKCGVTVKPRQAVPPITPGTASGGTGTQLPPTPPGPTPQPGPQPPVQPPTSGGNVPPPTTTEILAKKLRLVAIDSSLALPPLVCDPDTVVGRAEGPFTQVLDVFHNKGLSRRHCQFRRGPTFNWSVTDLVGRDTTSVGPEGRLVTLGPNATGPVVPGRDHIRLGLLEFKIEPIP